MNFEDHHSRLCGCGLWAKSGCMCSASNGSCLYRDKDKGQSCARSLALRPVHDVRAQHILAPLGHHHPLVLCRSHTHARTTHIPEHVSSHLGGCVCVCV